MNPTLTKASEALRESLADWQGNGDLPTFAVIAVLKAIREPDDEMLAQGQWAISDNLTVSVCVENNATAERVWKRMISAALRGQTTNPTANHGSGE